MLRGTIVASARVPAGTIEEGYRMSATRDMRRDFPEMILHQLGLDERHGLSCRDAARWEG